MTPIYGSVFVPGRIWMLQLRRAALAAVATAGAIGALGAVTASAPAAQRDHVCGAVPRSTIVRLLAVGVDCAEARRVALLHERSYQRRGACRSLRRACRVRPFTCALGLFEDPPRRLVICATLRRQQVTWEYRAARR
jgi:hypothetical protein